MYSGLYTLAYLPLTYVARRSVRSHAFGRGANRVSQQRLPLARPRETRFMSVLKASTIDIRARGNGRRTFSSSISATRRKASRRGEARENAPFSVGATGEAVRLGLETRRAFDVRIARASVFTVPVEFSASRARSASRSVAARDGKDATWIECNALRRRRRARPARSRPKPHEGFLRDVAASARAARPAASGRV